MREIFYEETSEVKSKKIEATKHNVMNILSIAFFMISAIWFVVALSIVPINGDIIFDILCRVIPEIVFLGSAVLFFWFKFKFCIDFDYVFTSGTIKISKVIKNSSRRLMFTFDCRNILILGKYGSNTYNKFKASPDVDKVILTSNETPCEGKSFYYLLVTISSQKKLLVLECSETLITNILKFSGKKIIEEDYK